MATLPSNSEKTTLSNSQKIISLNDEKQKDTETIIITQSIPISNQSIQVSPKLMSTPIEILSVPASPIQSTKKLQKNIQSSKPICQNLEKKSQEMDSRYISVIIPKQLIGTDYLTADTTVLITHSTNFIMSSLKGTFHYQSIDSTVSSISTLIPTTVSIASTIVSPSSVSSTSTITSTSTTTSPPTVSTTSLPTISTTSLPTISTTATSASVTKPTTNINSSSVTNNSNLIDYQPNCVIWPVGTVFYQNNNRRTQTMIHINHQLDLLPVGTSIILLPGTEIVWANHNVIVSENEKINDRTVTLI
jgi:hypothetical protein